MFDIINQITASGFAGISTLLGGTLGTIVYSVLGVTLFILAVSLLKQALGAFKGLRGKK